jgi:hypothetical protein
MYTNNASNIATGTYTDADDLSSTTFSSWARNLRSNRSFGILVSGKKIEHHFMYQRISKYKLE